MSERRWKNLRRTIYGAQGGMCLHCGQRMLRPGVKTLSKTAATREHLQCRVHGGRDHRFNVALAHRGCNADRDVKPLTPAAKVRRNELWAILRALEGDVCWLVFDVVEDERIVQAAA